MIPPRRRLTSTSFEVQEGARCNPDSCTGAITPFYFLEFAIPHKFNPPDITAFIGTVASGLHKTKSIIIPFPKVAIRLRSLTTPRAIEKFDHLRGR